MEGQISTCSPWRPHAGAGGCPKGSVTLWGVHAGVSSWQDLWPHGERSPHWSRFAGRACDPVGDPRWSSLFLKECTPWQGPTVEQFVESCSPWEGLMLEKFVENCLHGRDPTLEQRNSVRRKERQRQHAMNRPQPPFPVPLHCSGGGGR